MCGRLITFTWIVLAALGLGTGLLKDGEIGISATNRNFKGRMGSPSALAYLASPGTVKIQSADRMTCVS